MKTPRRGVYAGSMCGIGGIVKVWSAERRAEALATPVVRAIPEAWLDELDAAIAHRGPDGCGRFRDRAVRADGCVVDVALVHRRLSIIDHAGGQQPMLSLGRGRGVVTGVKRYAISSALAPGGGLGLYERDAASELAAVGGGGGGAAGGREERGGASATDDGVDERVCVVFNGCIYNHRELRAELQRLGHVFSTDHSDTEVLVHGYYQDTWTVAHGLDGMFAAIFWDSLRGEVTIARDRYGEKPLYTAICPGLNIGVFCSTVPGVLCAARAAGHVAVRSIPQDGAFVLKDWWLRWGYAERPPTTWVHECAPSSVERYAPRAGSLISMAERYGELPDRETHARMNSADRRDVLEDLLVRSVNSRLSADVPVACFLSGGVDSSLITAYAKRRVPALRTFCVQMPSLAYDESGWAEMASRHLGTVHQTLPCHPRPCEDLARLIGMMGYPLGDSSLLPSMWVCRAARDFTTVAIGGDGGDELFGGYERYRANALLNRLRRVIALLPEFTRGDSRSTARVARLVEAARHEGYQDLLSIFPEKSRALLLQRDPFLGRFNPEPDPLRSDFVTYLPHDLLRKSDTASMSVALELRSPMLAPTLVRECFMTPLNTLMPYGRRKGLLRQIARKHLPREIVDRPKMGFAIPIGEWFRTDYGGLRTMLLDHLNSSEPFGPAGLGIELNMAYVRQMLDEHLGTGPSGLVRRDHSQRLYMLLVLSVWARWLGA